MDEPRPKRYRLLIYRDSTVKTVILKGNRWLVGRAEDCDISLDDNTVSRKHLAIEKNENGFRFQDLGGTNQTLLNGRQSRTGELPVGGTLLVGLTRLTLDTFSSPSDVQVITDPMETSLVFRHYLDKKAIPSPQDSPAGHTEAIACFLERLTTASADFEAEEEVAKSYLEALLSHTRHRSGMIARFHGDILRALASVSRPGQSQAGIPSNLVQEIRARPHALFLRNEEYPDRSSIVVPMGQAPGGLIMIEGPTESAPPGKECLHLANTLAPMVWSRLLETRSKADMRKEVERLRYSRSEANAVVLGSARLLSIRGQILELAPRPTPVRILGEAGTESEELARYLHANSPRFGEPFVSYHAVGRSPSQSEIELIGSPDAELETADHRKCALMEAQGGTLFIDQPSALPTHLQDQLALTIQTGLLDRPGHQKVPVDVRLVASCVEKDGIDQSAALCPRLSELFGPSIQIPPLRSSTEDIFSLAEQYLEEMGSAPDGAPRTFTDSAKMTLISYHWPGNVKELRQVLETAATRAGPRPIAPRHLPKLVTQPEPDSRQPNLSSLDDVERRHIAAVLEATQGNRAMAAKVLGVAASTLYNRLKRFKMDSGNEPSTLLPSKH